MRSLRKALKVIKRRRRWAMLTGDSLKVLRRLPEASVDAIVTDPPAGIQLYGCEWDADKGGAEKWIHWLTRIMRECLRVLKPGGHIVSWSIPVTSHWTATAIERAGFEIRDGIVHISPTGMPKGLDAARAIRKLHQLPKAERQQLASNWLEWNTTLKPVAEIWILGRKPLDGTVAENLVKHGVGAINLNAARPGRGRWPTNFMASHHPDCTKQRCVAECPVLAVRQDGKLLGRDEASTSSTKTGKYQHPMDKIKHQRVGKRIDADLARDGIAVGTAPPLDALFTVAKHQKAHTLHPTRAHEYRSRGIATTEPKASKAPVATKDGALFFYAGKSNVTDRHLGCEDLRWRFLRNGDIQRISSTRYNRLYQRNLRGGKYVPLGVGNVHPTAKNTRLSFKLVKLITPPGGLVLDAFCGSGSIGRAALAADCRFIGIELSKGYSLIARRRIASFARTHQPLFAK